MGMWLPLTGQSPALVEIRIVEGQGAVYPIGSRATRGVTVEVTDQSGSPAEGVSVTFQLPERGPSGTFSSGGRTEVATTDSVGRATAWGMRWNRSVGSLEMRITAAKGAARASALCSMALTAAGQQNSGAGASHKWLWISLAVGGAAGAGLAARGGKPSSAAAAPAAFSTVTIGAPSVTIGRP
jgi:hypothetical protein